MPERGNQITLPCHAPCNSPGVRQGCIQNSLKPALPGRCSAELNLRQLERLFPLLPAPNLTRVVGSWRGVVWTPAALELEFPTGERIPSRIQLSLPGSASALSAL